MLAKTAQKAVIALFQREAGYPLNPDLYRRPGAAVI
jgi:hypothetical protein